MKLGWLEIAALGAASVVKVHYQSTNSPSETNQIANKSTLTHTSQADLAYSPPFYPSPWMDGKGEWAVAYKRAVEFVSNLTLAEKVNLTTGTG